MKYLNFCLGPRKIFTHPVKYSHKIQHEYIISIKTQVNNDPDPTPNSSPNVKLIRTIW